MDSSEHPIRLLHLNILEKHKRKKPSFPQYNQDLFNAIANTIANKKLSVNEISEFALYIQKKKAQNFKTFLDSF